METKNQPEKKKNRSKGISSGLVILGCAIVAFVFFFVYCSLPEHQTADNGNPNVFGTLYHGGVIIPCVLTLFFTVITLTIERFFALNRASGKGSIAKFVINAKSQLEKGNIDAAVKLCDDQKGSVANILIAGLKRYQDVETIADKNNAEKAEMIQAEIEEATTLELPYLEKNLNIIAAISSLGTLFGLLGTVIGMIKSFSAMSNDGAPDSTQLALGISEALMNTACGIGTGAFAIISYTYLTGRIANMTNAVDEVGFAVGQTYMDIHGGIAK